MNITVVLSNDKTLGKVALTYQIDLDIQLTFRELKTLVTEDCKEMHITNYNIEDLIFGE